MRAGGAAAVLLAFSIIILGAGCSGGGAEKDPSSGLLIVVATIHPLADLVRQVGGERVTVSCLLPAGASPHTYEPTAEQARVAATADLFVQAGGGLDEWAGGLIRAGGSGVREIDLCRESGLFELDGYPDRAHNGKTGPPDPHFWLDPLLVRDVISPLLVAVLAELAPENADYFTARLRCFQEELSTLHAGIEADLSRLSSRRFITFHAAWSHFAHRYGLEEVGVIARFPGQEPSAAWMAELVRLVREEKIRAIFAESQFSPALAEGIAAETGVPVFKVDPLGGAGLPGRETYPDLLRYNVRLFSEALR